MILSNEIFCPLSLETHLTLRKCKITKKYCDNPRSIECEIRKNQQTMTSFTYCLHKDCDHWKGCKDKADFCNSEKCMDHLKKCHLELTERIPVRNYVQLVARDHLGRFLLVKKEQ